MMMLGRIISRRWLLTTILVIVAMIVMMRLGIWQLDRLTKRRAFNARVLTQIKQPVLNLNQETSHPDLAGMEYRAVEVIGEYDPSFEIALRNQYWEDQWGVHLITPLHIAGSNQTVLVDRGWIPGDDFESGNWAQFDETGRVVINGVIRASQSKAELGKRSDLIPAPGEPPMKTWNFVNIGRIDQQVPYPLLPIYIQQAPDPSWTRLPHRTQPQLELTEGPHLSYAIQWFTFAVILGVGYPFFIRRQENRLEEKHRVFSTNQGEIR